MLETSRNINQWFAQASKLCGGKWYYQGDDLARAHQLMTRLCDTHTKLEDSVTLVWHNDPITKRGLETLWKSAPLGAIIAGEGYGVHSDNSVSRTVTKFAESHGIAHHHNRSDPAVWWIVKETTDASADHTEHEPHTPTVGESTLSGSEFPRDV